MLLLRPDPVNSALRQPARPPLWLLGTLFLLGWPQVPASAQSAPEAAEPTACTLKNHLYTCDAAAFQKALTDAKTVAVETHSVDKLAQAQLKDLLIKKLAKTVVPDGAPTDLVFLLIPLGAEGMSVSPGETDLGTLRVYSANPDGTRARLLWAETFAGQQDLPWPATVHTLIAQFQAHFHIK